MKRMIFVFGLLSSSVFLTSCAVSTGVGYNPGYSTYTTGYYGGSPLWGTGLGYTSGYRWGNRWNNRWYGRNYWGGGRSLYGGRGYYRGWSGRGHRGWGRRW